ncbi:MAG: outer membrane protein assembly factor [Bacteroidetes bacterium QS_9_68_14]|nr:MAG: outer membrane protein assembly factor [Bacteroidetes bacterium QS_9_68_14]
MARRTLQTIALRALRALLLALGAALLVGTWPGARPAHAHQASADTTVRADEPLVTGVRFEGEGPFARPVLTRRVRTAPNRRVLDIPGFTWWRWLYGLGDLVGGGVGGALKSVGEAPARLDRSVLRGDVSRLTDFYRQEGFRNAQVRAEVVPAEDAGEVRVVFRIQPGEALQARYARYTGLGRLPPAQRRRIVRGSLLWPEEGPAPKLRGSGDTLRFRTAGQRYSEARFLRERSRLLDSLRDGGYARATRDSVRALVFPQPAADAFDITFRVRPGPRYRVGDLSVRVNGPEKGAAPRTNTLVLRPGAPSPVTVQMQGESKLDLRFLRRVLRLRPGRWYSRSDRRATKRRLEATGLFTFTDITAQAPTRPDSLSAPALPHRITLRTRPRHRAKLETFALQRSGIVSNELGFGLGATYQNANLLSRGESFRARVASSLASDFDTDGGAREALFSSAQLEGSLSLTYPYLISAFGGLEALYGGLYDARTRLSLSLLTARRENLGFIIRGRGEARLRLEMQHSPTLTSLVDVPDLSLSNPDTLAGFRPQFLNRVIGTGEDPIVRDPVQRARILEDYTAPQVGDAYRYTLRASTINPLRRAQGYRYEAAVEVGGLLPAMLDRLVLTPDTVESSLPGLPSLRGSGVANRLRYRPYVRLVGDARRYRPLAPGTVLAGKLITGVAHPIGRPGVVPFEQRFYAGGGSSVRGWGLRELRPAPLGDPLTGDAPNLLGGDIKLEAAVELRQTLLENVLGTTNWIGALFADAGNAWIGPRNPGPDALRFRAADFLGQVGIGSGLGLRLDWDFLVVRLDMAFKAHDPLQASNPFPNGLSEPRLHFGIGHAF